MQNPGQHPGHDLVKRESGLIVPADLAGEPDPQAKSAGTPATYLPDGRLRILMGADDRKKINAAIKLLTEQGLAIMLVCRNDRVRRDGKAACGGAMKTEDPGTPNGGYGCMCSRVVFMGDAKTLAVVG